MVHRASAFWLFKNDIQAYLEVRGDEAKRWAKEQWEMGTDEIKLIQINYKKEAKELNAIRRTQPFALWNRTPRVDDLTDDIRTEYEFLNNWD